MSPKLLPLVLIAVLISCSATGAAVAQNSGLVTLADDISLAVKPYVDAGDFMGVVAVQRGTEPALLLAFGQASVELGVDHGTDSVFMIGSVSKQFTAAAILLLEEAGLVDTSEAVSAYLPGFKPGVDMTLEQLLTHRAGVADIFSLPLFGSRAGRSADFSEVIQALNQADLTFPPGVSYAYSNGGYAVLAAIIEAASGLDYADYLRTRIFVPLGMTDSAHDQPGPARPGRVPGYQPWGVDALAPAELIAPAFTTGSGSLWSSGRDLLTWSNALYGGELLTGASLKKLSSDYGNGYGYGVSVFTRFDREVIGHDGRIWGYASDLARYIDDELNVVILSNVESVARDEIRLAVAAAVLGEPIPRPSAREFARAPLMPLSSLAGDYSFGPGFTVYVRESDERLLARANEGSYSELLPLANGDWFSRMLYQTVRFEIDKGQGADLLRWGTTDTAPVGQHQ